MYILIVHMLLRPNVTSWNLREQIDILILIILCISYKTNKIENKIKVVLCIQIQIILETILFSG